MAISGKERQGDHDRNNMIERETNERRRKEEEEEEKSDLVEECDESSVQKMRGMGREKYPSVEGWLVDFPYGARDWKGKNNILN